MISRPENSLFPDDDKIPKGTIANMACENYIATRREKKDFEMQKSM